MRSAIRTAEGEIRRRITGTDRRRDHRPQDIRREQQAGSARMEWLVVLAMVLIGALVLL